MRLTVTSIASSLLAMSVLALLLVACDGGDATAADDGGAPPAGVEGEELPIGDIDDLKEDGDWTHAVKCKPLAEVPALADPSITISLDGLTLHLVDRAGSYDRVFPIGPGAIDPGAAGGGKSLTPVSEAASGGVFYTRTDLAATQDGPTPAQRRWGWNESCRVWWQSETGAQVPVFAGLPFIRLQGPSGSGYGIHGPIDSYTMPNGGTLRRGFVSHGCVRMEAADLVEVYGRIRGHKTPVRIQKATERRDDATAVDVANRWFLAECRVDADCPYSGGVCRFNPYSGHGFCTQRCDLYCPDKAGFPSTFCVADPEDPSKGVCTLRPDKTQNGCRRFEGIVERAAVPRHNQPATKKSACVPGSEGWVGDRCLADADCPLTDTCLPTDDGAAGICTEPCSRYCPDKATYASTFCVAAPQGAGVSGGVCAARCTSNDDCPLGTTCESEPRYGAPATVRSACVPY